MKDTLWFRFPDDTAASLVFTEAEKRKFEDVFSVDDKGSVWNRALDMLGLGNVSKDKLILWHRDTPYFNWSSLIGVISGGAITPLRKGDAGYGFYVSYAPRNLWRLFAGQWKSARFLQRKFAQEDALAESIALGLVMQAMILRLGKEAETGLPKWLSGAADIPQRYKKTVSQIQSVQVRRTALSSAWEDILPSSDMHEPGLPDYFWNEPPLLQSSENEAKLQSGGSRWSGLPVCAGRVTGKLVVIKSLKNADVIKGDMPLVLLFKRARPEAVELYPQAAAVVFAEGGVLSHACVVAREMNIPSVTGLGADFFDAVAQHDGKTVTVDGSGGVVELA